MEERTEQVDAIDPDAGDPDAGAPAQPRPAEAPREQAVEPAYLDELVQLAAELASALPLPVEPAPAATDPPAKTLPEPEPVSPSELAPELLPSVEKAVQPPAVAAEEAPFAEAPAESNLPEPPGEAEAEPGLVATDQASPIEEASEAARSEPELAPDPLPAETAVIDDEPERLAASSGLPAQRPLHERIPEVLPSVMLHSVSPAVTVPVFEAPPRPLPRPLEDSPADVAESAPVDHAVAMRQDVVAEPRAEILAEPRAEVLAEPRAEVLAEPRAEVPAEPRAEVPAEPRAEVLVEPRAEIPAEPRAEVPAEPRADVLAEPRAEIWAVPRAGMPAMPRPAMPAPTWPDVAVPSRAPARTLSHYLRQAVRLVAFAAFGFAVFVLALIVAYRWVNPPASTLMLGQWLTGTRISKQWVPIDRISPYLHRAVITAEDGRFCQHRGVDWEEIEMAIERARDGIPRGGSTISMQVVKNLFLWPSKSYVRKALEIPLTFAIELAWPKRRILEIYLNIAEWGPGIFGAEAAARYHFGKSAAVLTPSQAALLAVSLPNPLERKAGAPGPGTLRLATSLQARMRASAGNAACVQPRR